MKYLILTLVLIFILSSHAEAQIQFYPMQAPAYQPPVQYNVPAYAPQVYQAPIYVPPAPVIPTGGRTQAIVCVQTQFGLSCH